MYKTLTLFLMVLLMTNPAFATDIKIYTLDECIKTGIENNLQMKSSNYDKLLSEEEIEKFVSQYDLFINLDLIKSDSEFSMVNPQSGSERDIGQIILGLGKKFSLSGGVLSLEWLNQATESDATLQLGDPTYDSSIRLAYVQPLARNFLGVNDKRALEIAGMNKKIVGLAYDYQKLFLTNQIEKIMISLDLAGKNLKAQRSYLERVKKILETNRRKFKDGLVEEVDIIASESRVNILSASILPGEDSIISSEEDLKQLIGLPLDEECCFDISLSATVDHKEISSKEIIKKAFAENPQLKVLETAMEIRKLNVENRKNEALPNIDLVAQVGVENTSAAMSDNYDAIFSADHPSWYIGLNMKLFPWNKAAKSELRASDHELEKSALALQEQKLEIKAGCLALARELKAQAKYIIAARKSLELEEKKLKLEKKKYARGRSSIQWILEYENDMNNAQTELYKAIADYHILEADLRFIIGEIN